MSIEKLKAFCKFVEFNNSYGEAAQYSHKSSSAIYKNIKSLEEELGVSLVETLDKRPMLTQRGQVFSQHAKKLIELWDQAVNNISQSCAISGTLNILTTQAIASLWLFDDIADFIKANSNIKIIIKGSDQTNEHWEDYDVLIRPRGCHKFCVSWER